MNLQDVWQYAPHPYFFDMLYKICEKVYIVKNA